MDLSMLLSQAEMSYSKTNFYKGSKTSKKNNNQELIVSVFEQNLDLVTSFLSVKDLGSLRLLCRGVGYLFIVRDLWTGMKTEVADKKLEDIEDYEFVQQQPKQISKEDKKIRIHSLKKNMANSISKKPKRQASNIKEKKISMAVIDTELNAFQKTEMGFKRLLKTNNPSMIKSSSKLKQPNIDIEQSMSIERLPELLQIPGQYSIEDLIISPKDQWVKNMHRANNLISVVRKWNSFHQRFWAYISKEQSELITLMKKVIRIDGCLLSYKTAFQEEPHHTIVSIIEEGAPKNALIQDQLNKLGKEFVQYHQQINKLIQNKETEELITALHQCYQKISQKLNRPSIQAATWAQSLIVCDQAYDNILSKISTQKLKNAIINSIVNVFKQLIDQHLSKTISLNQNQKQNMKVITLSFLIKNAQFCQFSFQVLYNLVGKIATVSQNSSPNIQGNSSNIKQNQNTLNFSRKLRPMQRTTQSKLMTSTVSRFKTSQDKNKSNRPQKTLFGILWNISKYFYKLQKQLALKEKKKKEEQKVHLIKQFLQDQCNIFDQDIHLICTDSNEEAYLKSLTSIEEYYKEFKVKIERLKEDMAKTTN